MIKHDTYFTKFGKNLFKQHQEKMVSCYNQFLRHSIYMLPMMNRKFSREELKGVEYLLDLSTTRTVNELNFPLIRLAQEQEAHCQAITEDTFLVWRLFDYMYSYIIEMAILGDGSSRRLPDNMRAIRKEHKKMRMATMECCQKQHTDRKCPYEWVVYTKKNSAFFKYCQRVMDQNSFVTYDVNERYINVTPLSFYLVNFLCPVTTTDNEAVQDYDEWVRVPLLFIDLWHQRVI
jgi:hypothetical protein